MKSWTRTLNLDDAHTLLALAKPGLDAEAWAQRCEPELMSLSQPRRRELVRILRDDYLELDEAGRILDALFLSTYRQAPASAQIDLVHVQWALSHPLSLVAVEKLVEPALGSGDPDIPLDLVETLVDRHVKTDSPESKRKTRTVLLGALERVGVLVTRGTGQHRSLRAARARPHPITFGYLLRRDLALRGTPTMMVSEVPDSSLASRLTLCGAAHARACLAWCVARGTLIVKGDEVGVAA